MSFDKSEYIDFLGNPACNPATWYMFDGYDGSCCTSEKPCGLSEGDCDAHDTHEDCAGDLLCGVDNCGPAFDSRADCCTLDGYFMFL